MVARFEQYTASHLVEDYVTKYNTKGSLNSDNWNVSFKSIIKDYIDSWNCDKTDISLYAKYMYEICLFVICRSFNNKYCTNQKMFY